MIGRGLYSHPAKSVSLFLMLLKAYLGADTRAPPPAAKSKHSSKNPHESLRTSHPTWGPAGTPLRGTELLQTVQNCLWLQHPHKGCFSSWGLPEFTNGLSTPPATSPACFPRGKAESKRVLRWPGCRDSMVPRNSLAHHWCRGKGCKPRIWLRNCLF